MLSFLSLLCMKTNVLVFGGMFWYLGVVVKLKIYLLFWKVWGFGGVGFESWSWDGWLGFDWI